MIFTNYKARHIGMTTMIIRYHTSFFSFNFHQSKQFFQHFTINMYILIKNYFCFVFGGGDLSKLKSDKFG